MKRTTLKTLVLTGTILVSLLSTPVLGASNVTAEGGGVTVTLDSTGAVTAVSVEGRQLPAGVVAGGVFLRDLSHAAQHDALLLEEGWEEPGGWGSFAGNGRISFVRTDEDASSGIWSLLARLDNASSRQAGFYLSEPVSVTPGTTLRLQCRWKATRGYLGTDPGGLALQWGAFQVPPTQVLSGLELVPCDAEGTIEQNKRVHLVTFTGQAPEWKAAGAEWLVPPGITRVRVAIAAVLDPAYGDEAIRVDDLMLFPLHAPSSRLRGQVTTAENGARVAGAVGNVDLEVNWMARHGGVEAVVTATANDGEDHVFDLVLGLPVEATAWQWLDDWANARTISEPVRYAMAATADTAGWLPVSVYPYGGISDAASGLAAAVPLNLPVPALVQYDGASNLLEVCWHLALSPQNGHDTVTVSARFFAFDPNRGFRSIIDRYHNTWRDQTRWFQSPFDPSPFESFHRNEYSGERGARRCAEEEARKVLSLEYTVPDFVVDRVCEGTDIPPDFDGLLDFIQSLGDQGSACDQYYNTVVVNELSQDASEAPVLKYIGVRPWTNGWVQADFKMTPLAGEGEDGYWSWLSQCRLLPAFISTADPDPHWDPPVPPSTVDGVLLDNFGAHVTGDVDGDHLRLSPGALTYSPADYRPAVFLPVAYRAHMERLRSLLDGLPPPMRAIVINWKGLGIINADVSVADICADETDDFFSGGGPGSGSASDYAPWLVRYKRTLAYRKLRGTAFSGSGITRQDVEHTLAYTLLWGTAARFKDETVFDGITAEEADDLARAHNRLVAELQRAGWEPLTSARPSDSMLLVERYGSPPHPFFLVVTNVSAHPIDGSVQLDPSLGVTAIQQLIERTGAASIGIGGQSPAWILSFQDLGSFDSLLLEIVPGPLASRRPSGRVPYGPPAVTQVKHPPAGSAVHASGP